MDVISTSESQRIFPQTAHWRRRRITDAFKPFQHLAIQTLKPPPEVVWTVTRQTQNSAQMHLHLTFMWSDICVSMKTQSAHRLTLKTVKNTSQVTHVILSNSAVFLSNFSPCAFPSLVNFPCWSLHLHTRFCSRPAALNTCHTNTPTTDPTPPSQPRIHAFIHPSELKNNIQRAQQEERPCWFGGRRL